MTNDQANVDAFFGHILDDFKSGVLTKDQATGALMAFSVALNNGDHEEARRWAAQGRKLARDLITPADAIALILSPVQKH